MDGHAAAIEEQETTMHIQFAELPVFDQDRAKAFYTSHFACKVAADEKMGR